MGNGKIATIDELDTAKGDYKVALRLGHGEVQGTISFGDMKFLYSSDLERKYFSVRSRDGRYVNRVALIRDIEAIDHVFHVGWHAETEILITEVEYIMPNLQSISSVGDVIVEEPAPVEKKTRTSRKKAEAVPESTGDDEVTE